MSPWPAPVLLSPNVQFQAVIAHAPLVGVEVLWKSTGLFLFCWLYVKPGVGSAQNGDGEGLGEGDGPAGDGEGDGETPGDGLGAGEGDGVGVGDGDGLGEGLGDGAPAAPGVMTTSAVALEANVRFWPPTIDQRIGEMTVKWPVTVTVTRLPKARVHAGLQDSATSLGETVTNEPFDSRVAAHMIGSDAVFPVTQAAPVNVEGSSAAWKAPTRAALSTVIRE